jgi:mannose-6-phosphate isomerase-like protein (cupin superfamily)
MNNNAKSLRAFHGSIVKIRVAADSNADGLGVIEHKLPYGYAPPLHIHVNQDEMFHILRGRVRFEVGDTTFVAQTGDIMTAPKGVPHRFIVESEDGAQALVTTVGKDFENFVIETSSPITTETLDDLPPILARDIEMISKASSRYGIEIIGPPLTLAAVDRIAS